MTDRFVVPEPSDCALKVAQMADDGLFGPREMKPTAQALRIAYQQDLPRIVRAEVARALEECAKEAANHLYVDGFAACFISKYFPSDYLAARFPEAEPPKTECEHGFTTRHPIDRHTECYPGLRGMMRPAPSAKPETERCVYASVHQNGCPLGSRCPDRPVPPAQEPDTHAPVDSEGFVTRVHRDNLLSLAERQALARLTKALPFIEALAVCVDALDLDVDATCEDAARAFLRDV